MLDDLKSWLAVVPLTVSAVASIISAVQAHYAVKKAEAARVQAELARIHSLEVKAKVDILVDVVTKNGGITKS